LLFQDDFEDGNADGWALDPDWMVEMVDGNYVLSGRNHQVARPKVAGWTDYTLEFGFKIISGAFLLNFRSRGEVRYICGIREGEFHLEKQVGEDFFEFMGGEAEVTIGQWHKVQVAVEGANIKIYFDDSLAIDYTDEEIPIRLGEFSLEALEGSHLLFDEFLVTGVKLRQRTQWVKVGGPIGGLGYDVRIHPLDKSIMFVTDNPSGVNKSYNAGETWVQRNEGITARGGPSGDGIPIFSLTIDPNNPDIVWAGTQGMRGIFKSVDGGETWMKRDNGVTEWNEITFRGFAICPGNSDIVLAAAEISTGVQGEWFEKVKGKIYKTVDGGENWYPVWEGDSLARVLIFDPTDPDIVYASTGIFDREAFNKVGEGVLKSTDGGETWFPINNGLGKNLFIGFLDMHPTNPQVLIAAAGNETLTYIQGHPSAVYITYNGGEHWKEVLSTGDVFTVAAFSPSNPEVVYAGSEAAFYRSEDGGKTWRRFNKPEEECYGPPGIKPGIPISIVIDPDDPMTLFVNNYDGGVFRSTDGAETWVDSSQGYTGANIWAIAIDSRHPDTIYSTCRSSIFRSLNGGKTWSGLAFIHEAREPYAVAVNPENPREVLISGESSVSILKSTDGGNTWRVVFQQPQPFEPGNPIGIRTIAYAPSDPNIVYAGTRRSPGRPSTDITNEAFGIYKSSDGGETWVEVNGGLENLSKNINAIVVHPKDPDIAYAATPDQGVLKTTDGGKSWHLINNGLMSLDVESLAIDPKDPEIIYAGLGEGAGIYKTTNGGEVWEGINYGIQVECPSFLQRIGQVRPGISLVKPRRTLPKDYYSLPWTSIRSIVVDPVDSQIIYAADFYLGVYMSTDGGLSWDPINDGLRTKAVSALALSADGRVLYAATSGEGVFRLELW
jgi:photosystem II stability/assembly factor-like uncharacterized protein